MEDNTTHITKAGSEANPFQPASQGESRIFNTSVRGWIALILVMCLVVCMFSIFICAFAGVELPSDFVTQLTTLFISSATAAIVYYFQQKPTNQK